MAQPPLYKYLNVDGAKKTLGNRCLRFAKPSEYEDLEDMNVQSLFPDELEAALAILSDGFVDAIVANPYAPPTCSPKLRPAILKLQKIFREKPQLAPGIKQALKDDPTKAGLNVDFWRTRSDAFIKETNEFMQNYRVLCVTSDRASERMWKEYAKDSSGIALRIMPSVEKASKFELFSPVTYREQRPPIYAKTLNFAGDTMFGDHAAKTRAIMDTIIYSKTNDYRFENEYRLVIPLGEGEEDYRTLPYHPEEISELYLGSAMKDADKQEILATAKALNPAIKVFQVKQAGSITFEPVG